MKRRPPRSTLFPYTTLSRSSDEVGNQVLADNARLVRWAAPVFLGCAAILLPWIVIAAVTLDRKSTRLNSSHANISYAVFCLKNTVSLSIFSLALTLTPDLRH